MGKLDRAVAVAVDRVGVGLPLRNERRTREQVAAFIELSHHGDPRVRQVAVRNLCPCHIQGEIPEAWDRLFELATDPDPAVRGDVLHTVVDGSPRHMRDQVLALVEVFTRDPDRKRRRAAREALGRYRRTGKLTDEK